MELVLKIKQLAHQKGLTFAELERRLDFSNGQIARWNKQTPGIDKVQKVADYFNVSIDYLLSRNTKEDEYEQQLIAMFRKQTDGMNNSQKEKFNNSLNKLFSVAEALLKDDNNWEGE